LAASAKCARALRSTCAFSASASAWIEKVISASASALFFLGAALNCALFALFDYIYEAENASCNINENQHLKVNFCSINTLKKSIYVQKQYKKVVFLTPINSLRIPSLGIIKLMLFSILTSTKIQNKLHDVNVLP
jgi:hypothetical protein